jgi:hypothetical protein
MAARKEQRGPERWNRRAKNESSGSNSGMSDMTGKR